LTARPIVFWLARGAILVIVVLQIGIVNDLAVGPHWLAPGLELALLVPLSAATAWTQRRARGASTDAQWASIGHNRRIVRRLALVLTAICTLMNFGALARLIVRSCLGMQPAARHCCWTRRIFGLRTWWSLRSGSGRLIAAGRPQEV
jgi:hypothetical protein